MNDWGTGLCDFHTWSCSIGFWIAWAILAAAATAPVILPLLVGAFVLIALSMTSTSDVMPGAFFGIGMTLIAASLAIFGFAMWFG